MSADATHILISFCNTTPGAPSLALFEIATGTIKIPSVPSLLAIQKPAGIALSNRFLFVLTTRVDPFSRPSIDPPNPSGLFVFDRRSLTLLASHVCASIFDAHTAIVEENALVVVSTGSDEIVRVHLRGPNVIGEEVVWRADAHTARGDLHHLNAICQWRGDLVVSGFGRKTGPTWSTASNGFITAIRNGERLASGLKHPHSLVDVDGALVYCQSSTSTLHLHGTDRVQQMPGYARGIARAGDSLFVGTSRGRQISKSTGHLTNRGDPGATAGRCAIVRLSATTFEIEEAVQLERFGVEIYDLLPVSGIDGWPLQGETEWRDNLIAGLWSGFEERDAQVAWLHTQVSERDATVEWLHWEIAERDRSVKWLHQEVAERDRLVEELRSGSGEPQEVDREAT
jgi:hypothetical protein